MFIITKEFSFEAAHRLKGLPPEHPCSRHHGHSYKAIFTLKKTVVDEVGFVQDYRQLDLIKQWIDNKLDHRDLNAVFDFNPTAELIAKHLYDTFAGTFPDLASVTVKETAKTGATYEPYIIKHRDPIFTR
jgi:6-pyruvoyltetrahydropterin/6-carboxytetrahydropterin synthase